MNEYEVSKILDEYVTLPEVFQYYGLEIKNGFCNCPFHNEKTASCKVNKFQFNCFGCGTSGNAISFVKRYFNLDFKTAIQKINYDFNLQLLNYELTEEQKIKINRKKLENYKKKIEINQLEETKQQYFEAWKHFFYFKPEEKNYNIDTPPYLVDEYFDEIDPRWWEAKQTLDMLSDYAKINGFYLEEFEARHLFLDFKPRVYTDKECIIFKISKLIDEFNEQWRKKGDNGNIYKT